MAGPYSKPLPPLSESDIQRYWAKVDKRGPSECWPWKAARFSGGYGAFSIVRKYKDECNVRAHRVAHLLQYGFDPAPLLILHERDNPPCQNPRHLSVGTPLQNMQEKVQRGRMCDQRGARSHRAKLAEEQVRAILTMCAERQLTQLEIGAVFGISQSQVSRILRRECWSQTKA